MPFFKRINPVDAFQKSAFTGSIRTQYTDKAFFIQLKVYIFQNQMGSAVGKSSMIHGQEHLYLLSLHGKDQVYKNRDTYKGNDNANRDRNGI